MGGILPSWTRTFPLSRIHRPCKLTRLTPSDLQLNTPLDRFKTFYTSSHQGRLLSWRYQLFTLNLKARFPLGTKDLSVSLFQSMVLFLFNDVEDKASLTWTEIKERTGIGQSHSSQSC